jgi:hypothetical protein
LEVAVRPSLVTKSVVVVLCAVYFITNCAFAHAAEASFWAERKKAVEAQSRHSAVELASLPAQAVPSASAAVFNHLPPVQSQLEPSDIHFPPPSSLPLSSKAYWPLMQALSSPFGILRGIDIPQNSTGQSVVLIQDVHRNFEAQNHIGQTLQKLMHDSRVDLVALEGACDSIDLSPFHAYSDHMSIEKAADYLLKTQRISGAVHAGLIWTPSPLPPFIGVDDPVHYQANREAYVRSAREMAPVKAKFSAWSKTVEEQKAALLNPSLLAFDRNVQDFHQDKIHLGDYIQILSSSTRTISPSVKMFLHALEKERSLDFSRVEAERTRLIEALVKTSSLQQMSWLMKASVDYRLGILKAAEFYENLRTLCKNRGVDLRRYPSMDSYIQYIILSDQIQLDRLSRDVQQMEKSAYQSLAHTPEEKRLVGKGRRLYLVGQMIDFSLTPQECEEYKAQKAVILSEATNLSVSDSRRDFSVGRRASGDLLQNDGFDLSSFESFYQEAEIRNQLMAQKLIQALGKHQSAVLVAGGFHAEGIKKYLTAHGIAVLSFVPKITKLDSRTGSAYLSVLTQEKAPLDKLFQGEKLFLADIPFSQSARDEEVALPAVVRAARQETPVLKPAEGRIVNDPLAHVRGVEILGKKVIGGDGASEFLPFKVTMNSGNHFEAEAEIDQDGTIEKVDPLPQGRLTTFLSRIPKLLSSVQSVFKYVNPIPEAIALVILYFTGAGSLAPPIAFLMGAVAFRFIWLFFGLFVHGLGHTVFIVIKDQKLSFLKWKHVTEGTSWREIFVGIIPFLSVYTPGLSKVKSLPAGLPGKFGIRFKALGGFFFNALLIYLTWSMGSQLEQLYVSGMPFGFFLEYALYVANSFFFVASLGSDLSAFITGVAKVFHCGNFGRSRDFSHLHNGASHKLIQRTDMSAMVGAAAQIMREREAETQKKRIMGSWTQMRGAQSGGVATQMIVPEHRLSALSAEGGLDGMSQKNAHPPLEEDRRVHVIAKYMSGKRDDLTRGIIGAYEAKVESYITEGYRLIDDKNSFLAHTRYATGGPTTEEGAHPCQILSPRWVLRWLFRNGLLGWVVSVFSTIMTHNGDFKALKSPVATVSEMGTDGIAREWRQAVWKLFEKERKSKDVAMWLKKVLHTDNVTLLTVDSPRIAGMMDLLITQGMWYASVRLAYQLAVAQTLEDDAPSVEQLMSYQKFFEDIFLRHKDAIFPDPASSFQNPNKSALVQFVNDIQNKMQQKNSPFQSWTPEQRAAFANAAVDVFLNNDVARAVQFFISLTSDGSTFGLVVESTHNPHVKVLAAQLQPLAILYDPIDKTYSYASDVTALKAAVSHFDESYILFLDQTVREVAVLTESGPAPGVQIYSGELHRYLSPEELKERWFSLKDNPYIGKVPALSEAEDPMGEDIAKIPRVNEKIRFSWEEPQKHDAQYNSREGEFNTRSAKHLLDELIKMAEGMEFDTNAVREARRRDPNQVHRGDPTPRGPLTYPQILIVGLENSLSAGLYLQKGLRRFFPDSHNSVQVVNANEFMKEWNDPELKQGLFGPETIVINISRSGLTFPTFFTTATLAKLRGVMNGVLSSFTQNDQDEIIRWARKKAVEQLEAEDQALKEAAEEGEAITPGFDPQNPKNSNGPKPVPRLKTAIEKAARILRIAIDYKETRKVEEILKSDAGQVREVFALTQRRDSEVALALGQNLNPGAPPIPTLFTDGSEYSRSETATMAPVAVHQTITQLLLFLAKGFERHFAQTPQKFKFGFELSKRDIERLSHENNAMIHERLPSLVGMNPQGQDLETESPARARLLAASDTLSQHVLEYPYVIFFFGVYVFLSVTFEAALFSSAIPSLLTLSLGVPILLLIVSAIWILYKTHRSIAQSRAAEEAHRKTRVRWQVVATLILGGLIPTVLVLMEAGLPLRYFKNIFDALFYVFGAFLAKRTLRRFQGRQISARQGNRQVFILAPRGIKDVAYMMLIKAFANAYGFMSIHVHRGDAVNFLSEKAPAVLRGALLIVYLPDGRFSKYNADAVKDVLHQVREYKNNEIDAGPEVILLTRDPEVASGMADVDVRVIVFESREFETSLEDATDHHGPVGRLLEEMMNELEGMVGLMIMFHRWARKVSTAIWRFTWDIYRTMNYSLAFTTAAPYRALIEEIEELESDRRPLGEIAVGFMNESRNNENAPWIPEEEGIGVALRYAQLFNGINGEIPAPTPPPINDVVHSLSGVGQSDESDEMVLNTHWAVMLLILATLLADFLMNHSAGPSFFVAAALPLFQRPKRPQTGPAKRRPALNLESLEDRTLLDSGVGPGHLFSSHKSHLAPEHTANSPLAHPIQIDYGDALKGQSKDEGSRLLPPAQVADGRESVTLDSKLLIQVTYTDPVSKVQSIDTLDQFTLDSKGSLTFRFTETRQGQSTPVIKGSGQFKDDEGHLMGVVKDSMTGKEIVRIRFESVSQEGRPVLVVRQETIVKGKYAAVVKVSRKDIDIRIAGDENDNSSAESQTTTVTTVNTAPYGPEIPNAASPETPGNGPGGPSVETKPPEEERAPGGDPNTTLQLLRDFLDQFARWRRGPDALGLRRADQSLPNITDPALQGQAPAQGPVPTQELPPAAALLTANSVVPLVPEKRLTMRDYLMAAFTVMTGGLYALSGLFSRSKPPKPQNAPTPRLITGGGRENEPTDEVFLSSDKKSLILRLLPHSNTKIRTPSGDLVTELAFPLVEKNPAGTNYRSKGQNYQGLAVARKEPMIVILNEKDQEIVFVNSNGEQPYAFLSSGKAGESKVNWRRVKVGPSRFGSFRQEVLTAISQLKIVSRDATLPRPANSTAPDVAAPAPLEQKALPPSGVVSRLEREEAPVKVAQEAEAENPAEQRRKEEEQRQAAAERAAAALEEQARRAEDLVNQTLARLKALEEQTQKTQEAEARAQARLKRFIDQMAAAERELADKLEQAKQAEHQARERTAQLEELARQAEARLVEAERLAKVSLARQKAVEKKTRQALEAEAQAKLIDNVIARIKACPNEEEVRGEVHRVKVGGMIPRRIAEAARGRLSQLKAAATIREARKQRNPALMTRAVIQDIPRKQQAEAFEIWVGLVLEKVQEAGNPAQLAALINPLKDERGTLDPRVRQSAGRRLRAFEAARTVIQARDRRNHDPGRNPNPTLITQAVIQAFPEDKRPRVIQIRDALINVVVARIRACPSEEKVMEEFHRVVVDGKLPRRIAEAARVRLSQLRAARELRRRLRRSGGNSGTASESTLAGIFFLPDIAGAGLPDWVPQVAGNDLLVWVGAAAGIFLLLRKAWRRWKVRRQGASGAHSGSVKRLSVRRWGALSIFVLGGLGLLGYNYWEWIEAPPVFWITAARLALASFFLGCVLLPAMIGWLGTLLKPLWDWVLRKNTPQVAMSDPSRDGRPAGRSAGLTRRRFLAFSGVSAVLAGAKFLRRAGEILSPGLEARLQRLLENFKWSSWSRSPHLSTPPPLPEDVPEILSFDRFALRPVLYGQDSTAVSLKAQREGNLSSEPLAGSGFSAEEWVRARTAKRIVGPRPLLGLTMPVTQARATGLRRLITMLENFQRSYRSLYSQQVLSLGHSIQREGYILAQRIENYNEEQLQRVCGQIRAPAEEGEAVWVFPGEPRLLGGQVSANAEVARVHSEKRLTVRFTIPMADSQRYDLMKMRVWVTLNGKKHSATVTNMVLEPRLNRTMIVTVGLESNGQVFDWDAGSERPHARPVDCHFEIPRREQTATYSDNPGLPNKQGLVRNGATIKERKWFDVYSTDIVGRTQFRIGETGWMRAGQVVAQVNTEDSKPLRDLVVQAERYAQQAEPYIAGLSRLVPMGAVERETPENLRMAAEFRRIQELMAVLNLTSYKAPQAGIITETFRSAGQVPIPGQPIAKGISHQILADVQVRDRHVVNEGDYVILRRPWTGEETLGIVRRVNPFLANERPGQDQTQMQALQIEINDEPGSTWFFNNEYDVRVISAPGEANQQWLKQRYEFRESRLEQLLGQQSRRGLQHIFPVRVVPAPPEFREALINRWEEPASSRPPRPDALEPLLLSRAVQREQEGEPRGSAAPSDHWRVQGIMSTEDWDLRRARTQHLFEEEADPLLGRLLERLMEIAPPDVGQMILDHLRGQKKIKELVKLHRVSYLRDMQNAREAPSNAVKESDMTILARAHIVELIEWGAGHPAQDPLNRLVQLKNEEPVGLGRDAQEFLISVLCMDNAADDPGSAAAVRRILESRFWPDPSDKLKVALALENFTEDRPNPPSLERRRAAALLLRNFAFAQVARNTAQSIGNEQEEAKKTRILNDPSVWYSVHGMTRDQEQHKAFVDHSPWILSSTADPKEHFKSYFTGPLGRKFFEAVEKKYDEAMGEAERGNLNRITVLDFQSPIGAVLSDHIFKTIDSESQRKYVDGTDPYEFNPYALERLIRLSEHPDNEHCRERRTQIINKLIRWIERDEPEDLLLLARALIPTEDPTLIQQLMNEGLDNKLVRRVLHIKQRMHPLERGNSPESQAVFLPIYQQALAKLCGVLQSHGTYEGRYQKALRACLANTGDTELRKLFKEMKDGQARTNPPPGVGASLLEMLKAADIPGEVILSAARNQTAFQVIQWTVERTRERLVEWFKQRSPSRWESQIHPPAQSLINLGEALALENFNFERFQNLWRRGLTDPEQMLEASWYFWLSPSTWLSSHQPGFNVFEEALDESLLRIGSISGTPGWGRVTRLETHGLAVREAAVAGGLLGGLGSFLGGLWLHWKRTGEVKLAATSGMNGALSRKESWSLLSSIVKLSKKLLPAGWFMAIITTSTLLFSGSLASAAGAELKPDGTLHRPQQAAIVKMMDSRGPLLDSGTPLTNSQSRIVDLLKNNIPIRSEDLGLMDQSLIVWEVRDKEGVKDVEKVLLRMKQGDVVGLLAANEEVKEALNKLKEKEFKGLPVYVVSPRDAVDPDGRVNLNRVLTVLLNTKETAMENVARSLIASQREGHRNQAVVNILAATPDWRSSGTVETDFGPLDVPSLMFRLIDGIRGLILSERLPGREVTETLECLLDPRDPARTAA